MGTSAINAKKCELATSFRSQDWIYETDLGYCEQWLHKPSEATAEAYRINRTITDQDVSCLEFRNQYKKSLVQVLALAMTQQAAICSSVPEQYILTERIPLRLNEVKNLSTIDAKTIFEGACLGFNKTSLIFWNVDPREQFIGINSQGHVKVWVNSNFSVNTPQELQPKEHSKTQSQPMALYRIIKDRTLNKADYLSEDVRIKLSNPLTNYSNALLLLSPSSNLYLGKDFIAKQLIGTQQEESYESKVAPVHTQKSRPNNQTAIPLRYTNQMSKVEKPKIPFTPPISPYPNMTAPSLALSQQLHSSFIRQQIPQQVPLYAVHTIPQYQRQIVMQGQPVSHMILQQSNHFSTHSNPSMLVQIPSFGDNNIPIKAVPPQTHTDSRAVAQYMQKSSRSKQSISANDTPLPSNEEGFMKKITQKSQSVEQSVQIPFTKNHQIKMAQSREEHIIETNTMFNNNNKSYSDKALFQPQLQGTLYRQVTTMNRPNHTSSLAQLPPRQHHFIQPSDPRMIHPQFYHYNRPPPHPTQIVQFMPIQMGVQAFNQIQPIQQQQISLTNSNHQSQNRSPHQAYNSSPHQFPRPSSSQRISQSPIQYQNATTQNSNPKTPNSNSHIRPLSPQQNHSTITTTPFPAHSRLQHLPLVATIPQALPSWHPMLASFNPVIGTVQSNQKANRNVNVQAQGSQSFSVINRMDNIDDEQCKMEEGLSNHQARQNDTYSSQGYAASNVKPINKLPPKSVILRGSANQNDVSDERTSGQRPSKASAGNSTQKPNNSHSPKAVTNRPQKSFSSSNENNNRQQSNFVVGGTDDTDLIRFQAQGPISPKIKRSRLPHSSENRVASIASRESLRESEEDKQKNSRMLELHDPLELNTESYKSPNLRKSISQAANAEHAPQSQYKSQTYASVNPRPQPSKPPTNYPQSSSRKSQDVSAKQSRVSRQDNQSKAKITSNDQFDPSILTLEELENYIRNKFKSYIEGPQTASKEGQLKVNSNGAINNQSEGVTQNYNTNKRTSTEALSKNSTETFQQQAAIKQSRNTLVARKTSQNPSILSNHNTRLHQANQNQQKQQEDGYDFLDVKNLQRSLDLKYKAGSGEGRQHSKSNQSANSSVIKGKGSQPALAIESVSSKDARDPSHNAQQSSKRLQSSQEDQGNNDRQQSSNQRIPPAPRSRGISQPVQQKFGSNNHYQYSVDYQNNRNANNNNHEMILEEDNQSNNISNAKIYSSLSVAHSNLHDIPVYSETHEELISTDPQLYNLHSFRKKPQQLMATTVLKSIQQKYDKYVKKAANEISSQYESSAAKDAYRMEDYEQGGHNYLDSVGYGQTSQVKRLRNSKDANQQQRLTSSLRSSNTLKSKLDSFTHSQQSGYTRQDHNRKQVNFSAQQVSEEVLLNEINMKSGMAEMSNVNGRPMMEQYSQVERIIPSKTLIMGDSINLQTVIDHTGRHPGGLPRPRARVSYSDLGGLLAAI